MKKACFSMERWSCGLLLLLLASGLPAQLPNNSLLDSFASPEARLEMLEKTYTTNLRPYHGPVMQDYLRELELLKTKMTAGGRAADALAVEAEIARVRQAMATTGVFPYPGSSPAAGGPAKESGIPEPKPSPDTAPRRAVLALQAAKATGSTIAAGSAAQLGTLDWTVEKLAAGTYDVAIVYASGPLDGPDQLTLSLPGNAQIFTLPADRATGSDKNFRIFRLGTITLEKEITGGSARLQSSSATPRLWIRSLILSRPKAAPQPVAGT